MTLTTEPVCDHPHLGRIVGLRYRSTVESFLGLPYAKVSKRWTYAQPVDRLGDFRATSAGPICTQPPRDPSSREGPPPDVPPAQLQQDEFRCLNLNIVRPTGIPSVREGGLPVLVWIHGGAFLMGSASDAMTDPTALVEWSVSQGKPVIVVGINYRLGPFGFLYSHDLDAESPSTPSPFSGNYALHDQRLALEWIHRHISGFGGDPNRVTIAGQSSGGYAIHAQLNAQTHFPASQKLFSRAIIQSGGMAPRHIWHMARLDRIWCLVAAKAGTREGNVSRIAQMRNLAAEQLSEFSLAVGVGTWGVYADGVFVSPELFDDEWNFRPVTPRADAIMIGDCSDERSVFLKRVKQRGPGALRCALSQRLAPETVEFILKMYGLDTPTDEATTVYKLSIIAQHLRYSSAIDANLVAWPKSSRYHVALVNPFPEASADHAGMAHHGIESLYLFRNYNREFRDRRLERYLAISDAIGEAWLDFVYGREPWPQEVAAHFGKQGVTYPPRQSARQNPDDARQVDFWLNVGLVEVGRIANLWFSEQNDREGPFIY